MTTDIIGKGSSTLVIVLHEIYGLNQFMKETCRLISELGADVVCPNLIDREVPFDYSEVDEAYRHFTENIGFITAMNKVNSIIMDFNANYEKILIVGYSIGATIAWLCSEDEKIDGIIGFYGSRIRNYTEISPKCPTLLFFPEKEHSFQVDELLKKLEKENVQVLKLEGLHGFSDPYSPNYHPASAQNGFDKLLDVVQTAIDD
ncbi:dienelactone hydrolase family protein [uncultured Metabacillus sp.]|uniref:dienelactone hydrolase family protein n=1 Tax=uncultured Metabacillus sp. TaxID=2860135 RepID=UPI002606367E|nr:dienelactone hydrolase family protein [uncultured Metabacillus sp.]